MNVVEEKPVHMTKERFIEIQEKLKMTHKQLSFALGVNVNMISVFRMGRGNIPKDIADQMNFMLEEDFS